MVSESDEEGIMTSDEVIPFEEMHKNRNNCSPAKCLRCNHADMLHVERSSSQVRCGCKAGKRAGTWNIGYPFVNSPEECPDFSEVTDENRKQMVNIAWVISCERKMQFFRRPATRPVPIGDSLESYRIPFPKDEN